MVAAPWMPTYLGGKFFFDGRIKETKLDIEDIAHSLSFQCRYNGHTRIFYSVAEHCVRVANVVLGKLAAGGDDNPQLVLAALMHDAHEAVTGDIISPIKARYFDGKEIEKQVDDMICEQFGVDKELLHHPLVKEADMILLATEMRDLFFKDMAKELELPHEQDKHEIRPFAPEVAAEIFVDTFWAYKGLSDKARQP